MEEEPVNVNEFKELARKAPPKMYYDFYTGGAEDQYTLQENEEAFCRIINRPRILRDVRSIDLSTTMSGYNISMPVLIAPTSMHKLANPEGVTYSASKISDLNLFQNFYRVLSTGSTCSLEEVALSCSAIRFFQLFVYKRRDISAKLVQRAESNGYKAIVLTVDCPRIGRRESDVKNKRTICIPIFHLLSIIDMNTTHRTSAEEPGWMEVQVWKLLSTGLSMLCSIERIGSHMCTRTDIAWLKSTTNLPILIKRVLTSEDAIKSLEVGVSGIIVSNHVGRQLDYSPATIDVLEEVVHAVGGKVPVFIEGGMWRGTDVFKAMALAARAVLAGCVRTCERRYGVKRVLEMLKDELELAMALSGCSSLKEITRSHVRTEREQQIVSML
ncbi:Peroxisomal (S)-2-hydroxy-acid oxidase GLO4 [Hibiscus syriacus]|uniref:Peroxisomal (S)-2-hydroxy-acid oxidase GLO4 n=1 Tax=Hibiscus syriacus TaxID=106335 RepID=A0A6A2YIK0_HIBSY|nr:Peroxisomal (S)-2-hydroxy-acid oxidase GLO4 [Hibiscus syriacus]